MKYLAVAFWLLMATLGPAHAAQPSPMDYVEFSVKFIVRSKTFYANVFGWSFADYGPTYASFRATSIGGGFGADGSSASWWSPDGILRQGPRRCLCAH